MLASSTMARHAVRMRLDVRDKAPQFGEIANAAAIRESVSGLNVDDGGTENLAVDLDVNAVGAWVYAPDRYVCETVSAMDRDGLAGGEVADGKFENLAGLGAVDALVVHDVVD